MKKVQIIGFDLPDFIAEFKKSIIPEITENLSIQFQPKQPTEYLTRAEVCKILQIDLSTLHRWRKDGILTAYSIGNRIYFKRSELDAYINKNRLK